MFRPNSKGMLYRKTGRDVHGHPAYGAGVECPFAPVNLNIKALKTTVRADSSASRGSADETVSVARILIVPFVVPNRGDRFDFDDMSFEIVSTHGRRSVSGELDHYECDLQVLP